MTIRTRFAPSPTGYLHVGGARTALFAWLEARQRGGEFLLRIEDTDRERSTEEAVQAILDGLKWLDLNWDEGPFFQTERFDHYKKVAQQLLDEGKAYLCYCSKEELDAMREEALKRKAKPRYDGRCRNRTEPTKGVRPVLRFRNPDDGEVVFDDQVRGPVSWSNTELDDLIIVRSDGTPTYNFTVVVDDMDMGITHVIRGDDHINNTPRQINMYRALGAEPPAFAHVPMILGSDGARLSKRHGAVSVLNYRDEGYLPEALLNYLVRLGWSHGDQEIFSRQEMIDKFRIDEVNKAASVFNPEKLLWLNHHYIKESDPAYIAELFGEQLKRAKVDTTTGPALVDLVVAQRERSKTLAEMVEKSRYFFEDFEAFDDKAAHKHLRPVVAAPLRRVRDVLAGLANWRAEDIHNEITIVCQEMDIKFGKVGQPLRVAVTGGSVSPPIDVTMALIGKERCLERIDRAITYIAKRHAGISA